MDEARQDGVDETAVSDWRAAAAHSLSPRQIDRMASAFEPVDLARATA